MITNEILEMEETKKFLKWVFATKETQINRWLCQYQRLQDLKESAGVGK